MKKTRSLALTANWACGRLVMAMGMCVKCASAISTEHVQNATEQQERSLSPRALLDNNRSRTIYRNAKNVQLDIGRNHSRETLSNACHARPANTHQTWAHHTARFALRERSRQQAHRSASRAQQEQSPMPVLENAHHAPQAHLHTSSRPHAHRVRASERAGAASARRRRERSRWSSACRARSRRKGRRRSAMCANRGRTARLERSVWLWRQWDCVRRIRQCLGCARAARQGSRWQGT